MSRYETSCQMPEVQGVQTRGGVLWSHATWHWSDVRGAKTTSANSLKRVYLLLFGHLGEKKIALPKKLQWTERNPAAYSRHRPYATAAWLCFIALQPT